MVSYKNGLNLDSPACPKMSISFPNTGENRRFFARIFKQFLYETIPNRWVNFFISQGNVSISDIKFTLFYCVHRLLWLEDSCRIHRTHQLFSGQVTLRLQSAEPQIPIQSINFTC